MAWIRITKKRGVKDSRSENETVDVRLSVNKNGPKSGPPRHSVRISFSDYAIQLINPGEYIMICKDEENGRLGFGIGRKENDDFKISRPKYKKGWATRYRTGFTIKEPDEDIRSWVLRSGNYQLAFDEEAQMYYIQFGAGSARPR